MARYGIDSQLFRNILLILVLSISHQLLGASSGYATRYWDCCKPHCGWTANTDARPVSTCDINNQSNHENFDIPSSCDGGQGFTCYNMAPWAVSSELSYGFAAVPATGNICGLCYELTFTGQGHYGNDPGSQRLLNKKMIIQATNIGWDVNGGQFDLLIPGGGVGAFNGCSRQWQVSESDLGEKYGGFLAACKKKLGYNAELSAYKNCVQNFCEKVFTKTGREDLMNGCMWFVNWFEAADNPNLSYRPVSCPQELIDISRMEGRFVP